MNDSAQRVIEILDAFNLESDHPEACMREAEAWLPESGIDDPDLRDLTDVPFVTIDNEDSRDLDQALLIRPRASAGGFRVLYALADAAWYVRPGSALFAEALRRGVTFYAPGISVPMLPRSLSEDLISLNPNVDRRALVFDIALDTHGQVRETAVYRARIHSRAKLTYDSVQALLDEANSLPEPAHDMPYRDSLIHLRLVGELRIALARHRNVIEYNRTEPQVVISDRRGDLDIRVRIRNDVERYNEQISLLCNIEGAKLLERHARLTPELQSVFRVHAPPLDERLEKLRRQIDTIIAAHRLDASWRWRENTELAGYLETLPRASATHRIRLAIERQVMLTNNASQFSSAAGPHHALGVDAYARFSAPMREVVGIFTHKELLEAIGLQEAQPRAVDLALQAQVIEVSNFAKQQQKRLDKEIQLLVIERFLHADLGRPPPERPLRTGTLIGMDNRRLYVAVDGFALDLKVYKEDLESQWNCQYTITDTVARPDQAAAPVFRTGDEVHLRTIDWDPNRRRFVLEVIPSDHVQHL